MEKQIMQVLDFQRALNAPESSKPTMLPADRAELRQRLIEEEVRELKEATKKKDLVEIADAVIDSMYILIGTAHEYGFADRLIYLFDEVHSSNMSKFVDGKVILREDGKLLKPETFMPPNIDKIMNRDFSIYSNVDSEHIKEIEGELDNFFKKKIYSSIKERLHTNDKENFNKFLSLEEDFSSKVDVSVEQVGYRRKATIKVYDEASIEIWE